MRQTFINTPADMDWLFSVHLRQWAALRPRMHSAVLYGSEDSPERIEVHWDYSPLANSMAGLTVQMSDAGELVEVLL